MISFIIFYLLGTQLTAFRHGKFHRQSLWQAFSSIDSPNQQTDCETCSPDQSGMPDSPAFIVDPTTEPTLEELSNQNLIRIVNLETSDQQCNSLAWKCLGYRYNPIKKEYSNEKVFPKWQAKYPLPPDLIGVQRSYDAELDRPVRDASMALVRSIPRDFKGGVRNLEAAGFRGYKLSELTPNKTRRAQVTTLNAFYLKVYQE